MARTAAMRDLAADVELLYADYCDTLDVGAIARWPNFFTEDSLYRLTTRENLERGGWPLCFVLCEGHAMLRDRAVALESMLFYRPRQQRRIVSGIRLSTFEGLEGDGVECSASFLVCESVGDEPTRLLASGRSLDRVVRIQGELKFKQRLCVVDARLMPDSLIFPI